jgi:hypothetical protein
MTHSEQREEGFSVADTLRAEITRLGRESLVLRAQSQGYQEQWDVREQKLEQAERTVAELRELLRRAHRNLLPVDSELREEIKAVIGGDPYDSKDPK